MPRLARVIAHGVPHHITQRGNARRDVFDSDADRLAFLTLLRQYSILYPCSLVGYCLMSNHVHLIAIPHRADSLPALLRHTHGRYAAYLNARQGQSGHLWQGRYYSCPLDHAHLWMALRYVERNPVRARMVALPEDHPWSSAAAHCGRADRHSLLDLDFWCAEWTAASWQDFLIDPADQEAEAQRIRNSTHTGRPLGALPFVGEIERTLHRTLTPRKGGRPPKRGPDSAQERLQLVTLE
jgi:putative transposase